MPRQSNSGYADVLIGGQFGDEGKAKVVHGIAHNYDIIARFNGGANAGHSVQTDDGKKLALHQVPSGVFHPDMIMYIGSGCVVNIRKLLENEMPDIHGQGVDVKGRLHIAAQATLLQPHQLEIDKITGKKMGTTGNGMGPAYADKAIRRKGDQTVTLSMGSAVENMAEAAHIMRANLEEAVGKYDLKHLDIAAEIEEMRRAIDGISDYVQLDTNYLVKKVRAGSNVLFEGAQSAMLDVTKGMVPYVTASSTVAGAAFVGGDVPPNFHRKTIVVAKALMTRVGNGPFVSEFGGMESEEYCKDNSKGKTWERANFNADELLQSDNPFDMGIGLRMIDDEYGVTTKRPRRVGALDTVQLAHVAQSNGATELVLTKCDTLRNFTRTKLGKIPVVTGYELDGEPIDYIPITETNRRITPVITHFKGFTEDIGSIRTFQDMPAALKDLVAELEERIDTPITAIGTGPQQSQLVQRLS